MILKKQISRIALLIVLTFLSYQNGFSQCFQIESILVDACGPQEGLNEMVRFKVGATALNTSNLSVVWATTSLPWQGLVQDDTTASKTASLNADILDAGGCGQLIEPTGGLLPANSNVILVTSYDLDTALNSFGALTENIYIIYQNASQPQGHFANSGSGLRTLTISFNACSDTVTYDRNLLIDTNGSTVAADGAIVEFNVAGTPTYINNGCSAPVQPFTVNAGPVSLNACAGSTIALNGAAEGQLSVNWSAATGIFSSSTTLSTNYTISPSATGTITLTLTATNICGLEIVDTININITPAITPNFATPLTICTGSTAPILNTTSPNGITGTWSPSTVSNTTSADYIFTPNVGQCAVPFTLHVDVNSSITPNFSTPLAICTGGTAPVLNTTSPNGIIGTWSPSTVSNSTTADYVFTPNSGQCAVPFTLHVDVNSSITPNFATPLAICNGGTAPVLNTTSPNGITGTWSPATVSNTTTADYIFTPNAGQCAVPFTLHVDVNPSVTPNFATPIAICNGSTAPVLNTTSPNGITGTWSPATVSNTTTADYIFTPNAGQCAVPFTLHVDVNSSITPNFSTPLAICTGGTAPVLNTTSPNGITGTWSPSTVSNITTADYIFTPNAGQCAVSFTLHVDVNSSVTPNFSTPLAICTGGTAPVLNTTSPNGITGTWSPATVSNTATADYIFTPNAGQCAVSFTLHVDVNSSVTPNFATPLAICTGGTAPVLNTTSPNGITGTWSPSTVNNTTTADYIFTPNAGQCAVQFTLHVDVNSSIAPNFATPLAICAGGTAPVLNTTSPNGITGTWSPATVSNTTTADYIFTPNAGQCAVPFTLHVDVNSSITPNFATPLAICNGGTAPVLNTTSPNGITGTWSPSTVSNTTTADYIFTPNAGQCAVPFTLHVDVNSSITPNFATPLAICTGGTAPVLNTTSPNGITGTWSPATVSNTTTADYIFTPNAGQCAVPFTLHVDVNPNITPNFATPIAICNGSTAPVLNTTSPNGITGTWSPAVVSNTTTADYIFTPTAGQCAVPFTLHVDVNPSITPNFATPLAICNGGTAPVLNTTSPNGITGTWSPATVSNTTTADYIFTPNAGQCAVPFTLHVDVNSIIPDFTTTLTLCNGEVAPVLNTIAPNGITGSWSPSTINNTASADYVFTPDSGQCAESVTLSVIVSTIAFQLNEGCVNGDYLLQVAPLDGSFELDQVNYIWTNSQGNTVGTDATLNISDLVAANPAIQFPAVFEVVVSNDQGCITPPQTTTVYGTFCEIPKGISPNNDNKNDEFDLTGLGVKEITIFNRYGTEVYAQKNYSNQWKGQSSKGNELPDATYFYVLVKDNQETITGWVYINR